MKIIVTGANGQLGTELVAALGAHDVYAIDIEELDICDFAEVMRQVSAFRPDLVIHGAAYTDVDGAELNPDIAYKVNAAGTQNLTVAAHDAGASILYVSTDFVFDGAKGEPYHEFDDVNPLGVYGRSKLAGERYVTALTNRSYICRTAWLYGRRGHNFVKTMLKLGEAGGTVRVVDDQIGSPTYAADLAQKVIEIGLSGRFGLYHTTNGGQASWYEFARRIFELAGMDVDLRPITSAEFKRPARRPGFSVLSNLSLELQGIGPMRHWDQALKDYFSE
jgi:dTDP-4-dehydrorhamnose reductase